ncbi:MAG: XylR family transcriptional regulator [Opitutaceae bacterium]|nr:XylR family transcriptional regulator [Opitutaceae bacterium]
MVKPRAPRRVGGRDGPARLPLARVALLIESSRAFGRGVLDGIAECLRRQRWLVYYQEGGLGELLPKWFGAWQGDGIIARIEDRRMARILAQKGIPIVDIRGVCAVPGVPVVKTDNTEIARLAAVHLRNCGLEHFGYCGYEGAEYSNKRGEVFAGFIREAGFPCRVFTTRERRLAGVRSQEQFGWAHEDHLIEWLRSLPKPVGVMACNDARGHQLLNAARQLGIAVPGELAVIGVDNHETICELAVPPLSSVEQNTGAIAREAVALLERMMRGQPPPAAPLLVKPCKVVPRRSTDVLAVPDRNLRKAIVCIRNQTARGVGEIAKIAGVSRRDLERRFAAVFGHSPGQEVLAVQLQTVKKLLTETDWPLYRVAEKAGFRHPEYLNVAFKRQTGMTPRSYRLQLRRPA